MKKNNGSGFQMYYKFICWKRLKEEIWQVCMAKNGNVKIRKLIKRKFKVCWIRNISTELPKYGYFP